MKLRPLNNHLLVEITDPYAGLHKPEDDSQSMQKGVVVDAAISAYHLTMSTGFRLQDSDMDVVKNSLADLIGKTVLWQEHADIGQKWSVPSEIVGEPDKLYALIPYWRLIAVQVDKPKEGK